MSKKVKNAKVYLLTVLLNVVSKFERYCCKNYNSVYYTNCSCTICKFEYYLYCIIQSTV